jgi:CheY-like chemotaxis protein
LPESKLNNKKLRIIVIQNNKEQLSLLSEYINQNFCDAKIIAHEGLISAFKDITLTKYDLIFIDCNSEGFENFVAIKLIKAFNDKVPIIVTCNEENKFLGLKSVIEGADNYFIIRKNYSRMLYKIASISLKLHNSIDYIQKFHEEALPGYNPNTGKVESRANLEDFNVSTLRN